MSADEQGYPVRSGLVIPRREIWFEFSHASGPGGQNVNKVASAATVCFHPESSAALTPAQKEIIALRLANRINADGILRVSAEDGRSQSGNRVLAGERLCRLLGEALRPVKKRRPTRPTAASREKRLTEKRLRAARKIGRTQRGDAGEE